MMNNIILPILSPLSSSFCDGLGKVHLPSNHQRHQVWHFGTWQFFFETPWTAARQVSLSITNSQSLLKLMSIESVISSNHLVLWHPLLLLFSIFPRSRVFSNQSALCIRWPKYWSFCFKISPSKEYSGLISFRIDWFDLLDVQWTLKSTPASQVQRHRFFVTLPFLLSSSHIHTWLLEKP